MTSRAADLAGSAPPLPSPPAQAPRRWTGLALALAGSIAFSGKAIIVKLAYRHGVDAVTLIMLRMLLALPLFLGLAWWAGRGKPPLLRRDWLALAGLGFCGYYLASYLDFAGLAYISASLERLILYLNPSLVLLLGALLYGQRVSRRQLIALAVGYSGVALAFGHELSLAGDHVLLGAGLVFGSALSYAIYLIHVPLGVLLVETVGRKSEGLALLMYLPLLALSTELAHRLVEKPAMQLKTRLAAPGASGDSGRPH